MVHYYVVMSTMKRPSRSKAGRRDLGQAIRRRREAMNLSQEAFAEKVDCHRNYVSLVERGEQNVTIDMLRRIAEALRCSVAEVMKEAEL
jgi:transcriptional regulator with XRE-family HTH domain